MLEAISQFFQRTLAKPEQRENQTLTLELATAALLCEVMRADYDSSDAERAALYGYSVRRNWPPLYLACGFTPAAQLPLTLQQRLQRYQRHKRLIAMQCTSV